MNLLHDENVTSFIYFSSMLKAIIPKGHHLYYRFVIFKPYKWGWQFSRFNRRNTTRKGFIKLIYRQSPWMCTILKWKCTALNQSQLFLKEKLTCDWLRGVQVHFHAKIVHVQELWHNRQPTQNTILYRNQFIN